MSIFLLLLLFMAILLGCHPFDSLGCGSQIKLHSGRLDKDTLFYDRSFLTIFPTSILEINTEDVYISRSLSLQSARASKFKIVQFWRFSLFNVMYCKFSSAKVVLNWFQNIRYSNSFVYIRRFIFNNFIKH